MNDMEEGVRPENHEMCEILATVVTGFETLAKGEVEEKLNVKTTISRGHLTFEIAVSEVEKVRYTKKMRVHKEKKMPM